MTWKKKRKKKKGKKSKKKKKRKRTFNDIQGHHRETS